jgi:hypothetical protein
MAVYGPVRHQKIGYGPKLVLYVFIFRVSLLAQPVIIFVYGPASYLHYFRLKI